MVPRRGKNGSVMRDQLTNWHQHQKQQQEKVHLRDKSSSDDEHAQRGGGGVGGVRSAREWHSEMKIIVFPVKFTHNK